MNNIIAINQKGGMLGGRNYATNSEAAIVCTGFGDRSRTTNIGIVKDTETAQKLFDQNGQFGFSDVIFSFDYVCDVTEGRCVVAVNYTWQGLAQFTPYTEPKSGRIVMKMRKPLSPVTAEHNAIVYAQGTFTGSVTFSNIKIEVGDVASDWSPAPEDYLGPFNAYNIPNMHRNIFRGANLGTTFTDAQKTAIAAGTFDDLYLGDYWVMNGHTWRIVDIDYWYGQGGTPCNAHHVVVMPDSPLYNGQMNKTESGANEPGDVNTTEGGYALSDMRQTGLDQAKIIATTDFGTNVLDHQIIISNAVTNGHESGRIWVDSTVELCTEWQMYGAPVLNAMNDGVTTPALWMVDQKQFALMQVVPRFINPARQTFWLRDVVSSRCFAVVDSVGTDYYNNTSYVRGVRPAFGVTGD